MSRTLRDLLFDAAHGRFPPPDGSVLFVPQLGRKNAVVAFSAFSVIATDLPEDEVRARLEPSDFAATMSAPFLTWMATQLGTKPGVVDAVLVAGVRGGDVPLVRRDDLHDHPRIARARRYRDEVAVWADPEERVVVTLGRGLAGRMEISLEVDPAHRGKGFGRRVIASASSLAPPDEPLFAQVSPGNVASLRSFLAAGYVPIGAEVLFVV